MQNDMRERLIELIRQSHCVEVWDYWNDDLIQPNPIEALADHLIANGVVLPPCKVGDRVYSINAGDEKILKIWIEPSGDKITQIKINKGGYHFKCWWGYFHLSDIGKTVFLTKEQAEQKLKEMRDNNGSL